MISSPITYLLFLILEILPFTIFLLFIFTRTKEQTLRRWKASAVTGVISGMIIKLGVLCFGLINLICQMISGDLSTSLALRIIDDCLTLISVDVILINPIIILIPFLAYFRFSQSGDYLLDTFWKKTGVNYPQ